MDNILVLPDAVVAEFGPVSGEFLELGVTSFQKACTFVQELPYGYNSDREDLLVLFREKKGTCTTKHAVIATLAKELGLSVKKLVGIYKMTETLVTGTDKILERHRLPYLPMIHCFLASGPHRVDLTEGNRNGKNGPVDTFLFTQEVAPTFSEKEEYLLYRRVLTDQILLQEEFRGVDLKTVLLARGEGLSLLRDHIS
jgi:hypothetical protein